MTLVWSVLARSDAAGDAGALAGGAGGIRVLLQVQRPAGATDGEVAGYSLTITSVAAAAGGSPPPGLEARFGFTRKEARVARLLAEGRPNKEIARVLFVSPHTVRHHTQHLMLKLGARSRTAAAAMILAG